MIPSSSFLLVVRFIGLHLIEQRERFSIVMIVRHQTALIFLFEPKPNRLARATREKQFITHQHLFCLLNQSLRLRFELGIESSKR